MVLQKLLRAGEGKMVRRLKSIADAVNDVEEDFLALTDAELRAETDVFKQRLADGETVDDLLVEAFAVAREAARRTLGQRHFDVQVMGGAALHMGNIAEMRTGEGKTLTSVLPAYLTGLTARDLEGNTGEAGACTSSPSTTTWPAATRSGWAGCTASSASRSASSWPTSVPRCGGRSTPATSPTAPTTSSASTTCATTWL